MLKLLTKEIMNSPSIYIIEFSFSFDELDNIMYKVKCRVNSCICIYIYTYAAIDPTLYDYIYIAGLHANNTRIYYKYHKK